MYIHLPSFWCRAKTFSLSLVLLVGFCVLSCINLACNMLSLVSNFIKVKQILREACEVIWVQNLTFFFITSFQSFPDIFSWQHFFCEFSDLLLLSISSFISVETTALLMLFWMGGEPTQLPGESGSAQTQCREPGSHEQYSPCHGHWSEDFRERLESGSYTGKCREWSWEIGHERSGFLSLDDNQLSQPNQMKN